MESDLPKNHPLSPTIIPHVKPARMGTTSLSLNLTVMTTHQPIALIIQDPQIFSHIVTQTMKMN